VTSPTLELQGAIVARLKDDGAVAALVAGRVYDSVPAGVLFPYISLGPSDEVSEEYDCIDGFNISLQIDCWSRKLGFPEVRAIGDAVRSALKTELFIEHNALAYFQHRTTRTFRDPDGLTSHAAITFEAFAEQPT